MKPIISIIIPVLNEQAQINTTLSALFRLKGAETTEIIVVDGDTRGNTVSVIEYHHVVKILSPKGRSMQMNEGARSANGDMLLFLHADTRLPWTAFCDITCILGEKDIAGGAFDLKIDGKGPGYRIIEKAASLRSRLTRLPYGDQAIFVKKTWFIKTGGFLSVPLMEDINFMQRLNMAGANIKILPNPVLTSARRWKKEGLILCTLRNWLILVLYLTGVSPERLTHLYPENHNHI